MTDLPAGWRWATVDELVGGMKANVVIGPFGSSLKVSDYRDSGVPLVFVRNIRSNDFSPASARFVDPEKARELQSHQVVSGDVLITKMGDPPGDAALYSGPPGIITADCIRLRVGPGFNARYVALAFGHTETRQQIASITRGVAQKKVSLSRFRQEIRIPCPPFDEQCRIVDILKGHLSRLDAARQLMSAVGRRLEAYEAAALSRCRSGDERLLAEVASIQGGIQKHGKRAPQKNSYPFLRVANVTRNGLNLSEVHRIELFGGELERLRLRAGDLLVVEGNGSPSQIGRAAVWDGSIDDCVHQNHLIRVRPHVGLDPHYLGAVWNSPANRRKLRLLASSSSGLHTLSVSKLKSLRIPVPTIAEQSQAMEMLSAIQDNRLRLQDRVRQSHVRSERLRRALLEAAFSGRLTGRASDMDRVEEMAGV